MLAGGTGGAKLARGMLDLAGEDLVVIANTADDVDVYGAHVSPDPDLVTFWLADRIDERGWGLRGDTFAVMDGLRALGRDVWFNLGDRDLAWCIERAPDARRGRDADAGARGARGGDRRAARVLPMCDEQVRTRVRGRRRLARLPGVHDPRARPRARSRTSPSTGSRTRAPSAAVLDAIAAARAIVIGPSNPVISIGPILAVPGHARRAARRAGAGRRGLADRRRRGAQGPDRGVHGLGGPDARRRRRRGRLRRARDGGLLDAILADEPRARPAAPRPACRDVAPTLMDDPERRREWRPRRSSSREAVAR